MGKLFMVTCAIQIGLITAHSVPCHPGLLPIVQLTFFCQFLSSHLMIFIQGFHASWKVLDFFRKISRIWKVLKNEFGPGKSWN